MLALLLKISTGVAICVLKSINLGSEDEPAGNGPESLDLRKIAKSPVDERHIAIESLPRFTPQ